jgi:hypothetical protein
VIHPDPDKLLATIAFTLGVPGAVLAQVAENPVASWMTMIGAIATGSLLLGREVCKLIREIVHDRQDVRDNDRLRRRLKRLEAEITGLRSEIRRLNGAASPSEDA